MKFFIIGILVSALLSTTLWAGWSSKELLYDDAVGFWGMALGDGRNDGVNRFYLACSDSTVKESRPGEIYQTIGQGGGEMVDIAISPGRNDGVTRLYAICRDGVLYEYSCRDTLWDTSIVGSVGRWSWMVTLGVGRNDDSLRIYACNDSTIFEFTFREGNWYADTVDILPTWPIVVGPGRNDFLNRLYAKTTTGFFEYTYSGGVWCRDTIDTEEASGPLAIGPTRNDIIEFRKIE